MKRGSPREIFDLAREAEKKGKKKTAASYYFLLSQHLLRKKKNEQAQELALRATRLAPESPRLFLQLAVCEEKLNRSLLAEQAMDRYLTLGKASGRLEQYMPFLEAILGPCPRLRNYYFSAFKEKIKPSSPEGPEENSVSQFIPQESSLKDLIQSLERELDGEESSRKTPPPSVSDFCRDVDRLLGNDHKTRIDFAIALFEMELFEEARKALLKVPGGHPLFPEAQTLLGEISFSEGNWLEALGFYQKNLRDPRSSHEVLTESVYRLAIVYGKLNNFAESLKLFDRLEALGSDYRDSRFLRIQILEKQDEQKKIAS